MNVKLGEDAKLYFLDEYEHDSARAGLVTGTQDDYGFYTLGSITDTTEVSLVMDTLTMNLTKGQAKVATRGNDGWNATLGTLRDADLKFRMVYDMSDAALSYFYSCWILNYSVPLLVLDGDPSDGGVYGLVADFTILDITESQPLEEAQTVEITARPALTANPPAFVSSGSP